MENKKVYYCFIADDGEPHVVFVIMWHKGNLYLTNTHFDCKVSYHTPRQPSGKSQVHMKINKIKPVQADFCCPIDEIKGVRMLAGSGVQLRKLKELPKPKKGCRTVIMDTRELQITPISQVQWTWYLVEPGKTEELKKIIKPEKREESGMSEFLKVHLLDDSIPWIATEFIRICDENPKWYEGLENPKK